jgi:hypothetical protein
MAVRAQRERNMFGRVGTCRVASIVDQQSLT